LLVAPIAANFAAQGRRVLVLPSTVVDYEVVRKLASSYGLGEEVFRDQIILLAHGRGLHSDDAQPNVIQLKGVDAAEDFRSTVQALSSLERGKDQPLLACVSLESAVALYDEVQCRKLLDLGASYARQVTTTIAWKTWPRRFG